MDSAQRGHIRYVDNAWEKQYLKVVCIKCVTTKVAYDASISPT